MLPPQGVDLATDLFEWQLQECRQLDRHTFALVVLEGLFA